MIREIVLDTETTGLSPRDGHRIVEIGAVELINHLPSGKTYHVYLNPERDIPKEAEAVHELSAAFLKDKSRFSDAADQFLEFISDSLLIIHNASFDITFINAELAQAKKPPLDYGRVLDTLAIAKQKFPMASNSLDALCRRFGVDLSKRSRHGALLDSELLAEVYLELIGGKQTALGLAGPAQQGKRTNPGTASQVQLQPRENPLPDRLSQQDLKSHAEFVKTLGAKPLWRKWIALEEPGTE